MGLSADGMGLSADVGLTLADIGRPTAVDIGRASGAMPSADLASARSAC